MTFSLPPPQNSSGVSSSFQRSESPTMVPLCGHFSYALAIGAVTVFGFGLVWFAGHRGIFLTDQSMVFDGAWRISQGQVPYRDVLFPFGPVTFVIQAAFFAVFGVSFSTTVLAAAASNVVASLLTLSLIGKLLPGRRLAALLGALITSAWFQAPFGTLWLEQTAFLFALIALVAVVNADLRDDRPSYVLHAFGGLSVLLAVLSKQNAGLLFIPVLVGIPIVNWFHEPTKAVKAVGSQGVGFFLGLGVFVVWLWRFSNVQQYLHWSIDMSRSLAAERAPSVLNTVETLLTLSTVPMQVRWCALLSCSIGVVAIAAALFRSRCTDDSRRRWLTAGWIIVACLQFQQLFSLFTLNDPENCLPFLGMSAGLAFGLLSGWLLSGEVKITVSSGESSAEAAIPPRVGRLTALFISLSLVALPVVHGIRTSLLRTVQQFSADSVFTEPLKVEGLQNVKWADFHFPAPATSGEDAWLRGSDFEALNDWLTRHPGPFFVFPESTILYGLHRQPSPQPWLYFHEGHSFLPSDLARVDEVVVDSLRRNATRVVVIEKVSWLSKNLLNRMPELKSWIDRDFTKEAEFGIFEVWTLK